MKNYYKLPTSKTLLIILVLCTSIVSSQVVNSVDNSPSYQLANNSDLAFMSLRIVSSDKENPTGSYYLNEDFLPGTILFHNTKQKILLPVRFNAASNEIEIDRNGNRMAITPSKDMEVLFDDKSFIAIKNPKSVKFIFVQKLVNGSHKLYDFFEVKVNKAPSDASLLSLEQKDEIDIRPNLHFQINDEKIKPLPKRKKDWSKIFDQQSLDILKKQNLNLKKKEDAIVFFKSLNS